MNLQVHRFNFLAKYVRKNFEEPSTFRYLGIDYWKVTVALFLVIAYQEKEFLFYRKNLISQKASEDPAE